jgi:hypothetical protein
MTRGQTIAWVVLFVSMAILLCAVTIPLWLPGLVRAVVPDRYIVAYAPEPLQAWVFRQDADQTLPTVVPADPGSASSLLEELGPTQATTPTPLPTIANPSGIGPSTGTPFFGPTPTLTPAFASEGETTATPVNALPESYILTGFTHTYQGWNNCGPATLTTTLSYWGLGVTQNDVASFVKPNPEDRNVRPDELVAYVESLGYGAVVRVDGDLELLRRFIVAGYPVMIESGFDPEPDRLGWMGHYLSLIGYSVPDQEFTTMDSYLGPGTTYSYEELDRFWRHFNRLYLVVYPPSDREIIAGIIGDEMDDRTMYAHAMATAQAELAQNPNDAFGWFNIGSSLVALGDDQNGAAAFDQARSIGVPWRMLWYQFGPYEAYLHIGRNEDVLTLADVILADNEYSEEAYYYKGLVYRERGEMEAARNQFRLALRQNSHYMAAEEALALLGG